MAPHRFLIFRIILYILENFSNFVRYCRDIAAPLYSDMLVPCAQNPQSPVLRRKTHIYRKSLHPSSDHGASEVFFISKKEMEGNAGTKVASPRLCDSDFNYESHFFKTVKWNQAIIPLQFLTFCLCIFEFEYKNSNHLHDFSFKKDKATVIFMINARSG